VVLLVTMPGESPEPGASRGGAMKNTGWKLPLWAAYVVVTGMVGCASAGGQAGVGLDTSLNDSAERAAAVPPVYALLGERETIGLTSAQIAALDSLAIWLATTNRPLLEELSERGVRRNDGPTQEPGVARLGPPLLEEIGANNEAAEAAIQGLLT